jgi:23S rRNA pseudouridine2605 synthase
MSKPPGKSPPPAGDRIAKVLARRGVASRRTAEEMIAAGRVSVNGKVIDSPALNVRPKDRIEVDGKPLADPAPARLWLYHKPIGLVTTEKDEKGRPTVFAALPAELGRVMSVGRLDINSEGLLLLTNDGALKRRLELPATGWLRKYRVRVNGAPDDAALAPLRQGIAVEGERFQPMEVTLDRQQGANAWLTVGLREGRNREVRRAMEAVGLTVNRLIRVSYGPFRLGELAPGAVEEVRPKVVRDQLGLGGAASGAGRAEGDRGADRTAEPKRPGGTPRSAAGKGGKPPRRGAARGSGQTGGGRDRPVGEEGVSGARHRHSPGADAKRTAPARGKVSKGGDTAPGDTRAGKDRPGASRAASPGGRRTDRPDRGVVVRGAGDGGTRGSGGGRPDATLGGARGGKQDDRTIRTAGPRKEGGGKEAERSRGRTADDRGARKGPGTDPAPGGSKGSRGGKPTGAEARPAASGDRRAGKGPGAGAGRTADKEPRAGRGPRSPGPGGGPGRGPKPGSPRRGPTRGPRKG